MASGSKAAGCGSFLKCVVRNEILSIDANFIVDARYYSFVCYHIEIWVLCELSNEKMWEDRSLDCFAHKFGLVLSTQRVTLLGTALTDMISSVYNFLVLNFCTQGFLWGVLLLKGDEQGNIPVNAFVFLSIVFSLIFVGAKLWMNDRVQKFFPRKKNNPHKLNLQEFKVWSKLWVIMKF